MGSRTSSTGAPVTAVSTSAHASDSRSEDASGRVPQMSPSTAPASTDVSWSRSPTSTSVASGRTASTSFAISDSGTIDASSTTTTSCGSGSSRSCRNRVGDRRCQRSSRWRVWPCSRPTNAVAAAASGGSDRVAIASRMASSILAAALPVGAAIAMRGGPWPRLPASRTWATSSETTVWVLPVPGPPEITDTGRSSALATARRWRSTAGPVSSCGTTRSSTARTAAGSSGAPAAALLRTSCSWRRSS